MAHFAELDESNLVKKIVVVSNANIFDPSIDGENEQVGIDYCKNLFGQDTKWVQTSYNRTFRHNYAGIGYRYDETADAFIPPQPYPSWTLNTDNYRWDPPVPMPEDNTKAYYWDENSLTWKVQS